jgi:putative molybdopterin biosynthesis protein
MSVRRNVYLDMKTLEEARCLLFESFPLPDILAEEILPVPDAVDRVLAAPVTARISSPSFHVAAMDGIAVKAEITFGVSETKPKVLTVDEDAFYVNTGHVLPENTDAVIMVEVIQELDEDRVKIEAPAFPWQNVRKVGEDIVATELLFPQNHAVTPYCVGALLTGGVYSVAVRKRPKALIIPTGSELVDWRDLGQDTLEPGKVIESNSFVLGKLIESWGGTFVRNKMIRDDADLIRECVEAAIEDDFDFVLVAGGSSAGSEDYSKRVIQDLGTVLVHGVTIMPGKPIIIGEVRRKPVFGIPGYPVSAIIAFEQFVGPMMLKMLGQPERKRDTVAVEPTRKLTSKLGVEEFVRVKLGKVGDRIVATPLPRGAGSITSLTEADGIIRVPNHMEGLNEHAPVQAELLRPVTSLKHTIVVVGSHDNTLDILADQIKADHPDVTLSSSHVGSMGGLMALRKGVCHLAGAHLLDSTDGSYNTSYVKKYLPNIETKLVTLVLRDQGLIVPRGNPKGIKGIEDLAQGDISIINRQLGSGTRILLDYRLQQLGIENDTIRGYQNEEFTHMAVAVAVLSGAADVGLGIHAAAKALDLDFIPVITEQYDLVIPEIHFQTDLIQILLNTIATHDFKSRVQALGGYHTEKTGEISTPPV